MTLFVDVIEEKKKSRKIVFITRDPQKKRILKQFVNKKKKFTLKLSVNKNYQKKKLLTFVFLRQSEF